MIKIDLITGFLGSGKTTFIRRYAKYLMDRGLRIAILENDYGGVNIDRMLLGDLDGDQCSLEMVVGGSNDCCTHQRRLRTKLISLGMQGFDRVIVEPSGVYDSDEFFDVLHDSPLDEWYEIGSVGAVVDAGLEFPLSEEAEYLLCSQIASAGMIILSHTDEVSPERTEETKRYLREALARFGAENALSRPVLGRTWEQLSAEDFSAFEACGCHPYGHIKQHVEDEGGFSSVFLLNCAPDRVSLEEKTRELFENAGYGKIFRVKGYIREEDGGWLCLNAARDKIRFEKSREGQDVLIIVGENLQEDKVRALFQPYMSGKLNEETDQ